MNESYQEKPQNEEQRKLIANGKYQQALIEKYDLIIVSDLTEFQE